jgi:drug/metabolite transporter (DMT)-like permease
VFVLLWSTGFVVARYGTDDAGPFTFLSLRLAIAAVMLAVIATATRAPRISLAQARWVALSGLGMHALYLGGVFLAISWGMPSGVSALIAGLHPVVTSVNASWFLRERLNRVQWIGVGLGFAGVLVVVVDHLANASAGVTVGTLICSAVSIGGMSMGTLVQRRRGAAMPLLWGTVTQYAASSIALFGAVIAYEGWHFHVTTRSVFALIWALLVLSTAAVLIMLWLLQRHAAVKVSSLFFLTPALSTIESVILFGEHLGALVLVGLVVAATGVSLALRAAR